MKIVFSKARFIEKLSPVMGTVSNKNTIASIEGVLIEANKDMVRFSTYDMRKGTISFCECIEIAEEGSVIINASRLLHILRVLPEDEVTLTVDDKYNATIESGASSFSLFCLKGSDFPNLPMTVSEKGFSMDAGLLRDMIARVIHSVGEGMEAHPMLGGAYFHFIDGILTMVSCDSYTLSVVKRECECTNIGAIESFGYSFIIPGHALLELLKILPEEEELCKVYLTRKHVTFTLDSVTFFTRLIDEDYIDYERLKPTDASIFLEVDREGLLSGLERVMLVADEKSQTNGRSFVCLKTDGDLLTLTSTSVSGRVYDEIACRHEGEEVEIGFNCRFLINSIKAAEGEKVKLTMKSAKQSLTIEPADGSDRFFYMVLPVRM